jgi:hypothetical protein
MKIRKILLIQFRSATKVMKACDVQFTKQSWPMNSTEAGTVIVFSEEHPENAASSILRSWESDSKE